MQNAHAKLLLAYRVTLLVTHLVGNQLRDRSLPLIIRGLHHRIMPI